MPLPGFQVPNPTNKGLALAVPQMGADDPLQPTIDENQVNLRHLDDLNNRMGSWLDSLRAPQAYDYSKQVNDIGQAGIANAGNAPLPFEALLAHNQGALARLGVQGDFFNSHPAPQMATHDFLPTPERQTFAYPNRPVGLNEIEGGFAGGLVGALGGTYASPAIGQLTQRGQYLDERNYGDTLQHYQAAVQQANQHYNDNLYNRDAQLGYQHGNDAVNFQNALSVYNQAQQQAGVLGERAGINAEAPALSAINEKAGKYAQGNAGIQAKQANLAETERHNNATNGLFGQALNAFATAQQLHNAGLKEQGDLYYKIAESHWRDAMASKLGSEAQDNQARLPHELAHLDAQTQNVQAQTGQVPLQNAETQAKIKLMGSEAEKNHAQATGLDDTINSPDLNAASRLIDRNLQPYQARYDAAITAQHIAAKNQTTAFENFQKQNPGVPASSPQAQQFMKAYVDANRQALADQAYAENEFKTRAQVAEQQRQTLMSQSKALNGGKKGKSLSTAPLNVNPQSGQISTPVTPRWKVVGSGGK